jgi:uncharacterized membrane protein
LTRRLTPAVVGIVTFLVTSPFLFGGGSGDGDIPVFRSYGDRVLAGQVPYRDFHPEYPPGAFLFFVIPSFAPERQYLVVFQLLAALGIVVGLVLLARLVERLGATTWLQYGALVYAGLTPILLGGFTLRRFDMWPAALCVGVLILLLDERPVWALALLGVGAMTKFYPVLLLPVALLAVEHGRRIRAFVAFCAGAFVAAAPFAVVGHGGLYNSAKGQADRHLHLDSIGSSVLLVLHRPVRLAFDGGGWSVFNAGADAAARAQTIAQAVGVVAAAVLFARSRRRPWDLVAATVATLAVGACIGKVLSPQFLLWIAPLVVLSRSVVATLSYTTALVLTHVLFPARYGGLLAKHGGEIALLAARNAALVVLVGVLLVVQRRRAATVGAHG